RQSGIKPTNIGTLSLANTYQVRNTGRVILHFMKDAANNCDVVFVTPKTVSGLAVDDVTVRVPQSTGDVWVGPFPRGTFNDGSNDLTFTLTIDVDGLTVAALEI
ncbi:MAG: hypothetical protein ACUZ8A_03750, partial [Candidatus Bathyanammoxibius sp.]